MAGTFSKSNLPKRPGAYVNFSGQKAEPTIVNPAGVVAIPVTHTWGPENQAVVLDSWGEFLAKFTLGGTDTNTVDETVLAPAYTEAYKAVKQAFRGEEYQGRGGASQVIAYRLVNGDTGSALYAAKNTGGGNVTGVTLTAKYGGTYGNRLKVSVFQNASDSTKNDLVIYDNVSTVELERYTHVKNATAALVDTINSRSEWVTATAGTTGTALAAITLASLTGGTDEDPTTGDYEDALAALEPYRFSLFATTTTDASVITSITAWAANLNEKGKRFMTVVGGGASDSVDDAITRSEDINSDGDDSPNFVNLGVGRYLDDELGILTTAQLAPRVAGILADRGEQQNLTFARLTGLDLYDGAPTEGQILSAIDSGVVVIARDSNTVSPLRIEKGVTTYTGDTVDKPYSIYSSPKYLRTMQLFEMEITEWAEANVIGRLAVTTDTRNYVLAEMRKRLQDRAAAGIVQPGYSVDIDSSPAPTATDEFVALSYSLTFGRSLEQILNTIVVG